MKRGPSAKDEIALVRLDAILADRNELLKTKAVLLEDISTLNAEIRNLRAGFATLEQENTVLLKKTSDLEETLQIKIDDFAEALAKKDAKLAEYGRRDTEYRADLARRQAELDTTRLQFDDLKVRLSTAEADNNRMRGYIARVQEDDLARGELVTVGEIGGEQQLVPKRKPTQFEPPDAYSVTGEIDPDRPYARGIYSDSTSDRPRKAKHWVTY